MNVLHIAAGNRWTGAAATAFAEAEALRAAGVNAHYAYVGGYRLEAKIGGLEWTHPIVERRQNPVSWTRTAAALRRLIGEHGFDVVHAHLTWDHALVRTAAHRTATRIARTFHARRVLRDDPFARWLLARTAHRFVVNAAFAEADGMRGAVFTPPPLDTRQFSPTGPDARAVYGIDAAVPLVTAIGKLTADRGFEDVLRTFAALRALAGGARLMIIGHGPHRPALETLAASLGVAGEVVWAGYHEDDLAEHYRAADLLLFTAHGSDEGHRAVIEAQGCGVPVAAYPIEGLPALVPAESLAGAKNPEVLAHAAAAILCGDRARLGREAAARAEQFAYPRAAARLMRAYESSPISKQ